MVTLSVRVCFTSCGQLSVSSSSFEECGCDGDAAALSQAIGAAPSGCMHGSHTARVHAETQPAGTEAGSEAIASPVSTRVMILARMARVLETRTRVLTTCHQDRRSADSDSL